MIGYGATHGYLFVVFIFTFFFNPCINILLSFLIFYHPFFKIIYSLFIFHFYCRFISCHPLNISVVISSFFFFLSSFSRSNFTLFNLFFSHFFVCLCLYPHSSLIFLFTSSYFLNFFLASVFVHIFNPILIFFIIHSLFIYFDHPFDIYHPFNINFMLPILRLLALNSEPLSSVAQVNLS